MRVTAITLVFVLFGLGLIASSSADQPRVVNVGEQLPAKLRGLLIQEMISILAASQKIQAAIVRGDHQIVAQQAQAIHDSFIMAQEMTEEDEQALLAAVPQGFLEQDEALHKLSEELAEAGRDKDSARQVQHFAEMTAGCVACHSEYASARFPGL
ncbi:cytochrome c [Parahaliea sp. F7430]|uniref:Cytochrome c n=1 Tax=Sediminihaliea albiluteola TaxID=2758564 RepID=A0A7W2TW79_9GAMM|nr:cytochrome c [Sediminihaliea albiluteola]MBA6413057.1 cytochrome c [Sediminihaliea albiluteola]